LRHWRRGLRFSPCQATNTSGVGLAHSNHQSTSRALRGSRGAAGMGCREQLSAPGIVRTNDHGRYFWVIRLRTGSPSALRQAPRRSLCKQSRPGTLRIAKLTSLPRRQVFPSMLVLVKGYGLTNWSCRWAFLRGVLHFLISVHGEYRDPTKRGHKSVNLVTSGLEAKKPELISQCLSDNGVSAVIGMRVMGWIDVRVPAAGAQDPAAPKW